jgi:hypothetical protein
MSINQEGINIAELIKDQNLKPYFLDFVAKDFRRELFESEQDRFHLKIEAAKEFYESLHLLTEKLKYVVPDAYIQVITTEVSQYYFKLIGQKSNES